MNISRRHFTKLGSSAFLFASSSALLTRAGIAATPPIRLGNILDKTGGVNSYCLKQIQATALAVDEINAKGGLLGRQVQIVFYDSQSNNQLNSQYATQAFARDQVDVLFGGVTSSSREVMRPIVDKFKGLYFYNALYEGGVCDRRTVCTGMVPGQQIKPLVDYVVKEKGKKKGYILAADYNYGQIVSKWMQKYIREYGGEDVAVEFFPLDVTNFAPVLSRIQQVKPDVVWSALVGDAHMSFYRQYESTVGKKNIMLASTTYGAGRENASLSPAENEGILITTSFTDNLNTPAAKNFGAKFKAKTKEQDYIGEYGEYGYRGVMIWAAAVQKAKSAKPDAVIAALGGVTYAGPGGLYSVDGQTNHLTMDVHLAVGNRNGGFDLLRSFPQQPPSDTQQVCNLVKNPNDRKQYEPKV